MFLTYSRQLAMIQDLTRDSTATALTTFQREVNVASGVIFSELNRFIFEETHTINSVVGQQSYSLPVGTVRVSTCTVTSGNIPYVVQEIVDRQEWLRINQITGATSSYPVYFFLDKNTISLFPAPSSVNTITIITEDRYKEMTQTDYTTGNINALTNGSTALTANGTSFDSTFKYRWLSITANTFWYQIGAYVDATHLTLKRSYEGTTITGGSSAYTIGEQVLGQYEDLHLLPVWWTLFQHYSIKRNVIEAPKYQNLWETGFQKAQTTYAKRSSSDVIPSRNSLSPRYEYGPSNQFPVVPWP